MSDISTPAVQTGQMQVQPSRFGKSEPATASDLGQRFEKMLWAEMLSHTGLEEAFTQSGGKAASAFSQYMVEAIAEDIADRHPLGFDPVGDLTASATQDIAAPHGPAGKKG